MKTAYTFLGLVFVALFTGWFLLDEFGREASDLTQSQSEEKSMRNLTLLSSAFTHNGNIPSKYTCDGDNIIPPFSIRGVPGSTQSLVILMDDPDIPESIKQSRGIQVFVHWVIFNMPPTTTEIAEGVTPEGVEGVNSAGRSGYTGPCPPDREHRYFFKLYALDSMLSLGPGASKLEIEQAMGGHIIEEAELVGRYNRQSNQQ